MNRKEFSLLVEGWKSFLNEESQEVDQGQGDVKSHDVLELLFLHWNIVRNEFSGAIDQLKSLDILMDVMCQNKFDEGGNDPMEEEGAFQVDRAAGWQLLSDRLDEHDMSEIYRHLDEIIDASGCSSKNEFFNKVLDALEEKYSDFNRSQPFVIRQS